MNRAPRQAPPPREQAHLRSEHPAAHGYAPSPTSLSSPRRSMLAKRYRETHIADRNVIKPVDRADRDGEPLQVRRGARSGPSSGRACVSAVVESREKIRPRSTMLAFELPATQAVRREGPRVPRGVAPRTRWESTSQPS